MYRLSRIRGTAPKMQQSVLVSILYLLGCCNVEILILCVREVILKVFGKMFYDSEVVMGVRHSDSFNVVEIGKNSPFVSSGSVLLTAQ